MSEGSGMLKLGPEICQGSEVRMMKGPTVSPENGVEPVDELDQTMTQQVITEEDLDWWVTRAATLKWTFARTYAATAPHSYVVQGRTVGMTAADYVRAGRVIHTFGQPGKFYGMTSIYLTSPDGRVKWWTMDRDVRDTTLINQATTDRLYGVQNAPSTVSGIRPPTTGWPAPMTSCIRRPASWPTPARRWPRSRGTSRRRCSTSAAALAGSWTWPDDTGSVRRGGPQPADAEPLVRKHPNVAAVYPMPVEQALARRLFTAGQFEIVTMLLDPADDLGEGVERALASIASRGVIAARGDEVTVIEPRHGLADSRM